MLKFKPVLVVVSVLVLASMALATPFGSRVNLLDDRTVVQLDRPGRYGSAPLARDDDDYMTFRWMVSRNGGETWSEIMGAGDTGMWEVNAQGDTVPAWGAASYDFGCVVTPGNYLHFIAVLNAFSDIRNPNNRVNGVYDVRADLDGNVTYTLIAQQEGGTFVWSDAGVDRQGNIYAIWVKLPENEEAPGEIWASKSTNNGSSWSQPVRIANDLDRTHHYPHITYHVADYFYVLYEKPNPETGLYDHYVVKMASTLQGNPVLMNTGASSAVYFSYYVGSVNAIDQDWNNGQVYFAVRSADGRAVTVGLSTGERWDLQTISGAQRYPGVALDQLGDDGTPWVFSNFGVPAAGNYHRNWYAYDELGYNGGSWTNPIPLDSIMWDGVRRLLYCHQGVWTSEGRLVSGCNIWGQFTPEGFEVNFSDDGGANWHGMNVLYDIFEVGLRGGFIAQNILLAGFNNVLFVAFCGQYGETDLSGPEIANVTLSSFNLGVPWVVSAEISDPSGVAGAAIYWRWSGAAEDDWEGAQPDSAQTDEGGNGTYWFTMPSDTMNGHALADGDSVWFLVYAEDVFGNSTVGYENLLVVGQGWQNVREEAAIPARTELLPNYPNPFNATATIPFALNRSSRVRVEVWDTQGRLVATLYDGMAQAGRHTLTWEAKGVPSGVYIYTLTTPEQRLAAKMTLMR